MTALGRASDADDPGRPTAAGSAAGASLDDDHAAQLESAVSNRTGRERERVCRHTVEPGIPDFDHVLARRKRQPKLAERVGDRLRGSIARSDDSTEKDRVLLVSKDGADEESGPRARVHRCRLRDGVEARLDDVLGPDFGSACAPGYEQRCQYEVTDGQLRQG